MTSSSNLAVGSLLGADVDRIAAGSLLQQLGGLDAAVLPGILLELLEKKAELSRSDPAIVGGLLLALQRIAGRSRAKVSEEARLDAPELEASRAAYSEVVARSVPVLVDSLPPQTLHQHRLLLLLSIDGSDESLNSLAELLLKKPPSRWEEVAQVLSPLMQSNDWNVDALFPKVLGALQHRSVATSVLDFANFVCRRSESQEHPCSGCVDVLTLILGEVVGRLGRLEDHPLSFGDSVTEVQATLDEAVALSVSLCDALGLIGAKESCGKLFQAMQVKHRRVQTEAAGALARLGIEEGKSHLLALAAEPVARLRVLAYADELGLMEEVDEEFLTDYAKAEAELALWLAEPAQLGVPPTEVEVLNTELLYWPSYTQPVDCFLVRFVYDMGDRIFSNVGITGPVVHAVEASLVDLGIGDIYAVYAGWHVEHPQIFSVAPATWNPAQKRLSGALSEFLQRDEFEGIVPELLGFCFDEHALVATAFRDDEECFVATDGLETIVRSKSGSGMHWNPLTMWHWFLGRKLLRTFNPDTSLEI